MLSRIHAARELQLQITYLESIGSTQEYLKELLRQGTIQAPHAIVADIQTNGIGSRGNNWQGYEKNLFLSFAITLKSLPEDLKLESASIYFAYLLKETLCELGSKVWLKWPNDFYIKEKKAGGMITHVSKDILVCGVGLNLVSAPLEFARLDIEVVREDLLEKYFKKIEKNISWKKVFSNYELEFDLSKKFVTHNNGIVISLKNVKLQSDGSILSNGERIFSLR